MKSINKFPIKMLVLIGLSANLNSGWAVGSDSSTMLTNVGLPVTVPQQAFLLDVGYVDKVSSSPDDPDSVVHEVTTLKKCPSGFTPIVTISSGHVGGSAKDSGLYAQIDVQGPAGTCVQRISDNTGNTYKITYLAAATTLNIGYGGWQGMGSQGMNTNADVTGITWFAYCYPNNLLPAGMNYYNQDNPKCSKDIAPWKANEWYCTPWPGCQFY